MPCHIEYKIKGSRASRWPSSMSRCVLQRLSQQLYYKNQSLEREPLHSGKMLKSSLQGGLACTGKFMWLLLTLNAACGMKAASLGPPRPALGWKLCPVGVTTPITSTSHCYFWPWRHHRGTVAFCRRGLLELWSAVGCRVRILSIPMLFHGSWLGAGSVSGCHSLSRTRKTLFPSSPVLDLVSCSRLLPPSL